MGGRSNGGRSWRCALPCRMPGAATGGPPLARTLHAPSTHSPARPPAVVQVGPLMVRHCERGERHEAQRLDTACMQSCR